MPVTPPQFRSTGFGREKLKPGLRLPRHRHRHGYIAVVLSGGYQEAGLGGRFDVRAGDVVIHRPFDAHLDRVSRGGAEVLNLPLAESLDLPVIFTIIDPDEIARAAERNPHTAALLLTPAGTVQAADDWPDRLASDLSNSPDQILSEWAEDAGLARETLSRGFRKAYGVTPARFRTEVRAHRALSLLSESDVPLAEVAAECAFADQPHLSRAILHLTGLTPGAWRRRSIPFKTDTARPA